MRKRFEGRHGELFRERVYFGVFEELVAGLVDGRGGRVGLEVARGELVRKVFASVEVFEEAGGRFEVVVFKVDGVFLRGDWLEGLKVREVRGRSSRARQSLGR